MTSAGVAIRSLRKTFPDGTVALDSVDLDCPDGEILVLLGPSGCGKTTLLRCIAGLERPTSGSIEIDGSDVVRRAPRDRDIGMVFQNFGLYPDKTAAGNIDFPLKMAGRPRGERRRRVREIAELLQIDHLLERRPRELSGGQKQRVGIGRALATSPRFLLMDEPLSALDAALRVDMRSELLRLQRRLGTAMVYVTHDQTEALTLGDRVAVMREGRIRQIAEPRALFRQPAEVFVAQFLGGMNLLPGRVQDGSIKLCTGDAVAAPPAVDGAADLDVTIGVRTEDLALGPPPAPDPTTLVLTGTPDVVELLGADQLVHVALTDRTVVKVRCSAELDVPSNLTVHAPAARLHHFGSDGRRLSA